MVIHGFNKLTLTDFPSYLAAIVFTGDCNFRCPYCYNTSLVYSAKNEPVVDNEEIFNFLKNRKGMLDGLVITGGEPTLQPDLIDFIKRIKDLGYLVKLDSNGYNPKVLEKLIDGKYVDYIAMDVKNSKSLYGKTAGIENIDLGKIEESVNILKEEKVEYEFRTTVFSPLHTRASILELASWLSGSRNYYLQNFVDTENIYYKGFSKIEKSELLEWKNLLKNYIKNVEVRA